MEKAGGETGKRGKKPSEEKKERKRIQFSTVKAYDLEFEQERERQTEKD